MHILSKAHKSMIFGLFYPHSISKKYMLMQDSGELKGELIPDTLLPYLRLSDLTLLFLPFLGSSEVLVDKYSNDPRGVSRGAAFPYLCNQKINAALFERLSLSKNKEGVTKLAQGGQFVEAPADVLKSHYVLEFLDLKEDNRYSESDLETAIINKLEHFMLELYCPYIKTNVYLPNFQTPSFHSNFVYLSVKQIYVQSTHYKYNQVYLQL